MNLSFGMETIYDDAEFLLHDQDKVGIVGVNGAGKTTLFRLLLRQLSLDSGTLSLGRARIGYLPQEIVIEDESTTVWDFLFAGRPIAKLQSELEDIYQKLTTASAEEQILLLKQMAKLQEALDFFDPYVAENTLWTLIENMQIDPELLDKPMKSLSGGQKSKMAFARVLFSKPDILCLDEPTNHLDGSTKDFVTSYLKTYHGTVLIISHDIDFLNAIIHKVLYINKATHKISVYQGNYNAYQKKRAEEQRVKALFIANQEREIRKLSAFVQRANQASQTNHAIKRMGQERALRLEKRRQELIPRDPPYRQVKMHLTPNKESALTPLEVDHLWFHYPGQPFLYHNLSFQITRKERFLVVGENGVGKSTLLKLLRGLLTPTKGNIHIDPKTDIAYYAQELEQIDLTKTILENVQTGDYPEWQLRSLLGNFLFREDDVYKKAAILSPGEKARIALCQILLQKANLLLLDEPTNHLDPETQAIIGRNFRTYEGTMILVSHNPSFVEQIGITRMLLLPSGRIENYSRSLLRKFYPER